MDTIDVGTPFNPSRELTKAYDEVLDNARNNYFPDLEEKQFSTLACGMTKLVDISTLKSFTVQKWKECHDKDTHRSRDDEERRHHQRDHRNRDDDDDERRHHHRMRDDRVDPSVINDQINSMYEHRDRTISNFAPVLTLLVHGDKDTNSNDMKLKHASVYQFKSEMCWVKYIRAFSGCVSMGRTKTKCEKSLNDLALGCMMFHNKSIDNLNSLNL